MLSAYTKARERELKLPSSHVRGVRRGVSEQGCNDICPSLMRATQHVCKG
jgi:hypothetical protein